MLETPEIHLDKQKSGEILVGVCVLLLVFIMAARTPLDTDLWWHLRAGEVTVETGKPLLHDNFSYTCYGERWINHSWLAEVFLFLTHHYGGLPALCILVAFLATGSIGFVIICLDGPMAWRGMVVIIGCIVASFVWSARPQLFSLLFLAVISYLLYLYRWRRKNRLWLMPILFIFWSNLHGGYVLGFLLIGLTILGEIINHFTGFSGQEALTWKSLLWLAMWCGISLFAVLVNPNGIETWLIPFRTIGVGILNRFIQEWASPDFHDIGQQTFLWFVLLIIISISLAKQRVDDVDLATFCGFAYLGFMARRNFGPFAIVAMPVLARYGWIFVHGWWQDHNNIRNLPIIQRFMKTGKFQLKTGIRKGINLSIVVILGLTACLKVYTATQPLVVNPTLQNTYPLGNVSWLKDNVSEVNLFSEYNWGGYLIWNLREYPVFVDGRTDLFGDEILSEWINVIQADPGWNEILEKYEIRLILVQPDRPIVNAMIAGGWKIYNQDNVSVLLGK